MLLTCAYFNVVHTELAHAASKTRCSRHRAQELAVGVGRAGGQAGQRSLEGTSRPLLGQPARQGVSSPAPGPEPDAVSLCFGVQGVLDVRVLFPLSILRTSPSSDLRPGPSRAAWFRFAQPGNRGLAHRSGLVGGAGC